MTRARLDYPKDIFGNYLAIRDRIRHKIYRLSYISEKRNRPRYFSDFYFDLPQIMANLLLEHAHLHLVETDIFGVRFGDNFLFDAGTWSQPVQIRMTNRNSTTRNLASLSTRIQSVEELAELVKKKGPSDISPHIKDRLVAFQERNMPPLLDSGSMRELNLEALWHETRDNTEQLRAATDWAEWQYRFQSSSTRYYLLTFHTSGGANAQQHRDRQNLSS